MCQYRAKTQTYYSKEENNYCKFDLYVRTCAHFVGMVGKCLRPNRLNLFQVIKATFVIRAHSFLYKKTYE